ncbi:hypothetical protein BH23ACT5_BH23ACT5_04700 [soil metagenome]
MTARVVTFDADDTLWDFSSVVTGANAAVVEHLRGIDPGFGGTLEDLIEARRVAGDESTVGTPFPVIRRRAIERFVAAWVEPDPALVTELTAIFFDHRDRNVKLFDDVEPMLDALGDDVVVGVITNGAMRWKSTSIADRISFWLAADQIGVRKPDPRIFSMAAVAADCRPRDLVHVGDEVASDVAGAQAAGARGVWLNRAQAARHGPTPDAEISSLADLAPLVAGWRTGTEVGVGPHPLPWPEDHRLDPELLAGGDRRNVVDRYRYWTRQAIVDDLDGRRHPFHVAIENWHHDLNIGTVVRTANAFGATAVHIVGNRRWNRRGAMVTDRYQHVHHHHTIEDLLGWAEDERLAVIGIDNLPGATPLEDADLAERTLFVFGQESGGLSKLARARVDDVYSIAQFGSTRSINAGVAAGIAMHAWVRQHARPHGAD